MQNLGEPKRRRRGANADLAAVRSRGISCRGIELLVTEVRGRGRKIMANGNGIRNSVLQAIGNAPVVKLRKIVSPSMAEVLVKLEYYSPTGSYKDRMALAMFFFLKTRRQLSPPLFPDHSPSG